MDLPTHVRVMVRNGLECNATTQLTFFIVSLSHPLAGSALVVGLNFETSARPEDGIGSSRSICHWPVFCLSSSKFRAEGTCRDVDVIGKVATT